MISDPHATCVPDPAVEKQPLNGIAGGEDQGDEAKMAETEARIALPSRADFDSTDLSPTDHEAPGMNLNLEPLTDFGFEAIPIAAKTQRVQDVFHRVAGKYDLMNDMMSLGIHRLWKRDMVAHLPPRPNYHLVDVAGGTGDVARAAVRQMQDAGCSGRVTVCDLNASMLDVGRSHSNPPGLRWVCGNAENLPIPSGCADYYTVAFGLRNMTHRGQALKDALRVLKPGGLFLCLEFSHVRPALLSHLYHVYSFELIPRLGSLLAGDSAAYAYLVESIQRFPNQQALALEIEAAGFSRVGFKNYLAGVAALHWGWKTTF